MKNNKIIGFTLNLNFGFTEDKEDKNKIIILIEEMIENLLKDKDNIHTVLLGGSSEFIRENNNLGIKKMEE